MGQDLRAIKISVIIPAFNVSNYIERCLESALGQTLNDIEVIVVNDGSTDDTLEKIKNYSNDERLIIISKQNGGLSSARNAGLLKVRGEFIFHLDGDDFLERNGLEIMYEEGKKHNADIVLMNAMIDDDKGNISQMKGFDCLTNDHLQDLLLEKISANVWTKLYKTSLYHQNNIFHEKNISLGEDLLANILLFICSKKIVTIDGAFLHYIIRPTSITKTYNEKMLDVFSMVDIIKNYLQKYNLLEKYKDELVYLEFKHVFYYRIMVDVKENSIHRNIYDRCQKSFDLYFSNIYVKKFIKKLAKRELFTLWLYKHSYWAGVMKFRLTRFRKSIM